MGPIGEQIYGWIVSDGFAGGIKEVRGLVRGHSCIVGNAIHYLCKLGFADGRIQDLVDMLLRMQWDDGGWNCDRKPAAHSSSFNSTAIAVRGLVTYKRTCNSASVDAHIARGIAFLVDRQLCKRKSTNEIAHQDFMKLFFPEYYHYSYLYGLKVVAESGHGHVEQLDFALDCLNNQKTALGWSAGKKYYWKSKAVESMIS